MRNLLLTTVLLMLALSPALAQQAEGNPFKRLGYKASVYTFGDDKEFHDQETIVEIGDVLYNTETKEVVGFIEDQDSLIELKPELQSMSIDPHCEKYYSITPYAYCMNNPIKFIDPDGRDIWIYYQNEDGKEQQILYSANMTYNGNNKFVSQSISYLNAMYSNGGSNVLSELINSNNNFNFKNQLPVDRQGNSISAMQFSESNLGGGDIYAGVIMDSKVSEYRKTESVSHELFHGLQYEKGQGGASIFNEIEARVFSSIIVSNWLNSTDYFGPMSATGLGNGTSNGNLFEQSFNKLVKNGFSEGAFQNAIKTFKNGASANESGTYNNYPLIKNPKSYLLKLYYPK